ncbi:hypothetical protein QMY03_09645 [Arthrobacter sp. KFRI-F3372]|nr:hypothetical protein QMY03_09645 [Arthrobacter sp. KFRI-F3372]
MPRRFLLAGLRALLTYREPAPAVRALKEVGRYRETEGSRSGIASPLNIFFEKQDKKSSGDTLGVLTARTVRELEIVHPQAAREVIHFFESELGKTAQRWLLDVYNLNPPRAL